MNDNLTVFTNEEFGTMRILTINGDSWFVGKDVAMILGYSNTRDALAAHVDEEDKTVIQKSEIATLEIPNRGLTVINESGLYSLILSSKLPAAKKFKHWVTSEVLPSIRKHGVYATPVTLDNMIADPDFAIRLLTELKEERKRSKELEEQNEVLKEENEFQAQQIAELNPKATYYDEVLNCVDALPIGILAKDYGWSPQQLNNFLNENKIQYKRGNTWLLYASYQDKGYTKSETFWFKDKNGNNRSNIQTKWTQKGRLFIYELMKSNGNLPLIEQE